jgi:DNA-binding transcriptional ArsR family regulator
MPAVLCDTILQLLEGGKQLSISHITRELKSMDREEHRLVVTGYLRALRDLGKLDEIEVPPSKTYKLLDQPSKDEKNIYLLLRGVLQEVESHKRFYVAVFIVSNLFARPVFKEELKLLGIPDKLIETSLSHGSGIVTLVSDSDVKELRKSITRIMIPESDPAYELSGEDHELMSVSFPVLLELSKEIVDLRGLVPKTKQLSIENYS